MKELDSQNQSAFIRKMAIDGYAVNVDLAPVKELVSLQRRCVNNLAQIAKYAQANNTYQAEIMELQKGYDKLWEQYSTLLEHLARLVAL
ncbi:plasmid mobilization relaxosome protein MobC [Paenibacillus kribbensis]|uniref:plasmid mobilization relaxosome protein MobC n=1 Tax=Paenibacillus kribbensis TaxID=172713 RepID=UPI00210D35C8|nr:plasmid mobilization relaxosome protein MobC [Paenibacillus kribbensis]